MREEKVIQSFEGIDISVTVNDIEDWHHLSMSENTTIVRLVNRRNRNKALENKKDPKSTLENAKQVFQSDVKIFLCETCTPYNQYSAWTSRELKQAKRIHSCWNSKDVVKTLTKVKYTLSILQI